MRIRLPGLTPDEARTLCVRDISRVFPDRPDLLIVAALWDTDADGRVAVTLTVQPLPPINPDLLNRYPADVRKRMKEERYGRTDWRLDSVPHSAFLPERA